MKFKEYRKKIGTQVEFGKLINARQSSVAGWESGQNYPRRPMLKKLSGIFGISEGEILESIDNSRR